jgi:hypothetical protein
VKLVEELELPELTPEQTESLCTISEDAARKYILSKVSARNLESLYVTVEAEGSKPLNLSVEVDLQLTAETNDVETKSLADEAAKQAMSAAENYLRKLR